MRGLIIIFCFVIAQGCCYGQIKRTSPEMKTEIFKRELSPARSLQVYRSSNGGRTVLEIVLAYQGRSSSRALSVPDNDAIALMKFRGPVKLMNALRFEDARIDPATGDLLAIVDKFGFVDVLRYRLGADSLFSSAQPEVMPLRSYELMPRDVELEGEYIEDVAIAQGKLVAMTTSGYRHSGSYFISILDLGRKTTSEFLAGSLDIRKANGEIRDESIQELTAPPFNDIALIRVLNSVKAKGGFGDQLLRLRFALLSLSFRESFSGQGKVRDNALFFVEIGGKPMVMFYTNLNEWYIAPEDVLKPQTSNARHSRADVERLFLYQ